MIAGYRKPHFSSSAFRAASVAAAVGVVLTPQCPTYQWSGARLTGLAGDEAKYSTAEGVLQAERLETDLS